MERKLASIQKISEIIPIGGAEKVEIAKVLGWTVIVGKGQFNQGDLCVFFEVDSVLPERKEFEFMRDKKFRVKTMKSNRLGVVSQGLALPLSISYDGGGNYSLSDYIKEEGLCVGSDVTEVLGVQKYEPPTQDGKNTKPKGVFPTHLVPKTDETRIQTMPNLLDEMKGLPYIMTVKLDGTSFTCYYWRGEFGVCSRNLELRDDGTDVYWKMARKYNLPTKLKEYCETTKRNIAIQGEICGKLIAENPLGLKVDELFVFGVYDIDNRTYLDTYMAIAVAQDLGLKFVPIEEVGDNFNYTQEQLLEKAKGKYVGTNNTREGLVIRPKKVRYSPSLGNQLSFKVINLDYLLEEK